MIAVPYLVLGGADFGGGILDLMSGSGDLAERRRHAIAWAMGPVWEANHVWLIFVLVGMFTLFPLAFEAASLALYFPLGIALLGIVLRGSAFAFRGHYEGTGSWSVGFGRVFGAASLIAPFAFGAGLAALADNHIVVVGDRLVSPGPVALWTGPFEIACGLLAVCLCAYLAAVFLGVEMSRIKESGMVETFRRSALVAGAATGIMISVSLAAAAWKADRLFDNLTDTALPFTVSAILAYSLSVFAVGRRRHRLARASAAISAAAILGGFARALYPHLVGSGVTVGNSASPHNVQVAFLVLVGGGLVVAIPSLYLLYVVFRRDPPPFPK